LQHDDTRNGDPNCGGWHDALDITRLMPGVGQEIDQVFLDEHPLALAQRRVGGHAGRKGSASYLHAI
jgi:hypothetical protein